MQRFERLAVGELAACALRERTGAAGQFGEIGVDARTRHAVHAGRRIGVVEPAGQFFPDAAHRSEEHTSELQSLMRISYAVFCLKKKKLLKPPYTLFLSIRQIVTITPQSCT